MRLFFRINYANFYFYFKRGKTPAEMELAFLEKVSQFDTYGAELIVVKVNF